MKWMSCMVLYVLVSGTGCLVTVHQPPAITSALGHDVVMPCELRLSDDEKMLTPPVLYWVYVTHADNPRLWIPSEAYEGRIDLLDKSMNSSNKSILLKNVQWSDSGKYQCKLSVTTEREKSFRRKGNETLLLVYDNIIFNLTNHNASRLQCEVNVSRQDPGFVLAIFHNGCKLQTVGFSQENATLSYTTLSQTILTMGGGKYECQLRHNEDLMAKSIFHYHPPVTEQDWNATTNVSTTCLTTVSGLVVVFPEPWLLYIALLLVPITFLLGLLTARLLIGD
ncbi:hypothetical protein Q5P01_011604 [Channa striata]|uniref:Ig-like domain-containing protein n=1 Tax=Channa striata TaxID=64152 RepID=A0AA88SN16_CHASR|nr:hypothetical protein Q5P01_011604 [Channa striata]